MKRLIVSDLDGTLLNRVGEISSENAKAIKEAQKEHIKFVVATGRPYEYARKSLQDVGISCPIIALNGAEIFSQEGKKLKQFSISQNISKQILYYCLEEDIYIELFTNKGGFTTDYEKYLQVILDIFQTAQVQLNKEEILDFGKKRFKDEDIQIVKDYLEIINDEDSEVYKILAFSHKHEKLEHIKSSLNRIESLVITSSGHGNLEFNDENAQKGIAIKTLANYLGLEMKDVMAIGDNLNDVSMLKMAGLSVAMGNSDEKIQEMCDFTTKTNNEHGVAFAIKYMLSKDCQ